MSNFIQSADMTFDPIEQPGDSKKTPIDAKLNLLYRKHSTELNRALNFLT